MENKLPQQINLKEYVQIKFGKINLIDNLNIQLIIPANSYFKVTDNLLDLELFSNNLEIILNDNSKLDYVFTTQSLKTCKDFCKNFCEHDYKEINKTLHFKFIGKNSNANIKLFCNGAGKNSFKIKTIQEHQASFSKSNLIIKSALSQKSSITCESLIKVSENLEQIEATQLSKSILFECSTKAMFIPKLEVKSEDVICKHGATISKMDDQHFFYLQSRGINYCDARNLLIKSFLI